MNPFLLLLFGLLLILLEFFVPGAVMGILGTIFILISILVFAAQDHSPLEVFLFVVGVVFSLGFLIRFTLKRIPKAKPERSIYLKSDQEGYVASSFDAAMIGKNGVVLTDLKPSGYVVIDDKPFQAISQSEYIVKGKKVVVIDGRGAYLVVKLL